MKNKFQDQIISPDKPSINSSPKKKSVQSSQRKPIHMNIIEGGVLKIKKG